MSESNPSYAAFVGIDWADQKHDVCLMEREGERHELCELPHTPEAIDAWARDLEDRFGGQPVAVCLEQSRGPLMYALMKYSFLLLFPVNPKQLARFREALGPSGAKDDPRDAWLLAELLRHHHARLRRWTSDDEPTRRIQLLAESRRQLVDDRTRLGNRLTALLKEYFPFALTLCGAHIYTESFLRLLARWPSLKALQRARPQTVESLLFAGRKRPQNAAEQVAAIRQAIPLVKDPALIEVRSMAAKGQVALLQALNRTIADHDDRLRKAMSEHPQADVFRSLPGAGEALAPRLLAAMGSQTDRYESAAAVQRYSGIAPVTRQSGNSRTVRRRRACPTFLRQTFHEFAQHSLGSSRWARAFYRLQRERGKKHHAAVRSLAYKWIRIIFRCWHDNTPYNERQHLANLRRHDTPLLKYLSLDQA